MQDLKERPGVLKIHTFEKCANVAASLKAHARRMVDKFYASSEHQSAEGGILPGLEQIIAESKDLSGEGKMESNFDFKQTAMHDNSRSAEELFQNVRPSIVNDEGETAGAGPEEAICGSRSAQLRATLCTEWSRAKTTQRTS